MTTTKTTPSELTGQSRTRTYPQLVATIVINEIIPRRNRFKLKLSDFPVEYCSVLCQLEFLGKISRKKHREFLDEHCKWVMSGRPRDLTKDEKLIQEMKE